MLVKLVSTNDENIKQSIEKFIIDSCDYIDYKYIKLQEEIEHTESKKTPSEEYLDIESASPSSVETHAQECVTNDNVESDDEVESNSELESQYDFGEKDDDFDKLIEEQQMKLKVCSFDMLIIKKQPIF